MDGVTWFLLGMLFGVFLVVAGAVTVFCRSVEGMDDQGEQSDG
ncbi:hypothetical protein [Vreelandella aquamarina]|jgi:heme/copper-type cytochrome/quinol oxidase subunit 2|nr:hypothetical protein [Halomonas aquamarina]